MKQWTEQQLREYWQLMKKGMRISRTMQLYKITREEAIDLYEQAEKLHRGGLRLHQKQKLEEGTKKWQREIQRVPHFQPDAPKKIVRPPAKYDNMSREDYINKYLNMDV